MICQFFFYLFKGYSFFFLQTMDQKQLHQLAQTILDICQDSVPKKITYDFIKEKLGPSIPFKSIGDATNLLLQEERITLTQIENQFFYSVIEPPSTAEMNKLKGLSHECKELYKLVVSSKNKGIWAKDLRIKSRQPQSTFNAAIKILENDRKLIKKIKTIGRNKKVYMKFDLEPSKELTGGAWYNDLGEFDADFVAILSQVCLKYIQDHGYASSQDLETHIRTHNITKDPVNLEDIQMLDFQIINTLIYDGLVEEFFDNSSRTTFLGHKSTFYKPSKISIPSNGLTQIPCGNCPVSRDCSDDACSDITPAKCPYLQNWLELF